MFKWNIFTGNFDIDTDEQDLSIYWKSDGTSTATGNWSIGEYSFTAKEISLAKGALGYDLKWEGDYPGIYGDYGDFFLGTSSDPRTYVNYYDGEYVDFGMNTNTQAVRIFGSLEMYSLTASQILALDADKKLQSLSTATYPSLTELSYVKGVTSAIQTQLDDKADMDNVSGVVEHGATAGTARPSGYANVTWIGSVSPDNAENGDVWISTA